MVQYGFYYDNSRCTGCKTCLFACHDHKNAVPDAAFAGSMILREAPGKRGRIAVIRRIARSTIFRWRATIAANQRA